MKLSNFKTPIVTACVALFIALFSPNSVSSQTVDPRFPMPQGSPWGHLGFENKSMCRFDFLVAYVPKGGSKYKVDGWFRASPLTYISLGDPNSNDYILTNDNYPTYFYGRRRKSGRSIYNNQRNDKFFDFERKRYRMQKVSSRAYNGRKWITLAFCIAEN